VRDDSLLLHDTALGHERYVCISISIETIWVQAIKIYCTTKKSAIECVRDAGPRSAMIALPAC
jgi:hypothetical protein